MYSGLVKTIAIKISVTLDRWLTSESKRLQLSKSEITRLALEKLRKGDTFISVHDLMKDVCGTIKGAPRDLSTNPKYMDGFGK